MYNKEIERKEEEKYLKNKNTKDQLVEWLKKLNVKYHLTVNFSVPMRQKEVHDILNLLYRMVNNDYFGSNNKKKDYIKMYAFKEMDAQNAAHFHILVLDHDIFKARRNEKKMFIKVVRDKSRKLIKNIQKRGKLTKVNIIGVDNGIKVQDYYHGNLESYVLKNLEKNPNDFDFISISSYTGFDYDEKTNEKCMKFFFNQ